MARKPKETKIEHATTVTVDRSIERSGGEVVSHESESDYIAVHQFTTAPAEIGTSLGMTLNVGDFESVRIDITCKIPCYKEEVAAAYDFAFKFCEDRLREEISEVRREQLKKNKKET